MRKVGGRARQPLLLKQSGMVLLEGLIALLIFSIAIIGLIGIQANMIANTTEAQFRSIATHIAQQKIGRVWANPSLDGGARNDLIEAETLQPVDPSLLPSGFSTLSAPGDGMVRVTVTWSVSSDDHEKQVKGDIPKNNNVTIDARVMEWDAE